MILYCSSEELTTTVNSAIEEETARIRQQIITDIQISVVLNNIHNILNNIQYFLIIFLIVIFMSCISYLIN